MFHECVIVVVLVAAVLLLRPLLLLMALVGVSYDTGVGSVRNLNSDCMLTE